MLRHTVSHIRECSLDRSGKAGCWIKAAKGGPTVRMKEEGALHAGN